MVWILVVSESVHFRFTGVDHHVKKFNGQKKKPESLVRRLELRPRRSVSGRLPVAVDSRPGLGRATQEVEAGCPKV